MCDVEGVAHLKIPLQHILSATNDFAKANVIGRGGFGKVYRAQSEHYGKLAVKRLVRHHGQGTREFMTEIALLSIYKHENLVSLVGFCDEDGEKILVYEFAENGSLDKFLNGTKIEDLSWVCCLLICLGVARGLRYLHYEVGSQHRVIHRDIKSANILLDENWKAMLSDFGLSRVALANVPLSVVISDPCGTLGYVDPEFKRGLLSQKSDVYSFGIVLFEVLLGRLVIDEPQYYIDEVHFSVQVAQNHYEKKTLDEIIDPHLRSQMDSASLSTFAATAYGCLKDSRDDRPTMRLVVEELEKALHYQVPLSSSSSRFRHDVYISFRDQDTGGHIVDRLCAALHQEGLSNFKDDTRHSRKDSVLLKAIEGSRCFVIIFSKNFAANSWHLDEAGKIIECMQERRSEGQEGGLLIPLYYGVYPSDVRTQSGYFGEAISKYDPHPRMRVWKKALVQATNLPGLDYSDFWVIEDLGKEVATQIKRHLSRSR